MSAKIIQISVNSRGGVPKSRAASALITQNGVTGDKQRDLRYHGGPERAVCLFSLELIQKLQGEGHPIAPGTTGENLTVSGLDWADLEPGTRLQSGEVELVITSYTAPCSKIAACFDNGSFKRISQKVHPGWSRLYAKVLREGIVHEGDVIELATDGHG